MAVNNIRMLIGIKHKFKGCSAEKGKPLRIIIMTIVNTTVEKVSFRMGFDEETLSGMNKPKKDRTVNLLIVKWNPEIVKYFLKPINMVITHAVVFGQYNFNIISRDLDFSAEPVYYISKATHFRHWCTLRRNHDNKHVFTIPSSFPPLCHIRVNYKFFG
jgi:hypothetical protein